MVQRPSHPSGRRSRGVARVYVSSVVLPEQVPDEAGVRPGLAEVLAGPYNHAAGDRRHSCRVGCGSGSGRALAGGGSAGSLRALGGNEFNTIRKRSAGEIIG